MEQKIKGKVIVVTGSAQGIGFAIAEAFVQHGAKFVAILDINEEKGHNAVKHLLSTYGADKALFYQCDVTKNFNEVFEIIIRSRNTVDVLVNCAGVYKESSLQDTIRINAVALMDGALKFWEYARKDKGGNGGTIINIASTYAFAIDPFCPFYKASKHAVMGFTTTMGHAYNFKQSGVRLIAICPGLTKTEILNDIKENEIFKFRENELIKCLDQTPIQEATYVAKAVIDVFKTGQSGSAWTIINSQTQEIIFPNSFHFYNV